MTHMKPASGFVTAMTAVALLLSSARSFAQPIPQVTIGGQVWMAENLDVATFRNGDPIPEARTEAEWRRAAETRQPAWCHYGNDPGNGKRYGRLYNGFAVTDPRGLAPAGWHMPTDAEWTALTDQLGGPKTAGAALKSSSGWKNRGNGSNASGFSARPGGDRGYDGLFVLLQEDGGWWSATIKDDGLLWGRTLRATSDEIYRDGCYTAAGFSVRCIRD
jgi:uncharacterized protein (TIGR02145 family)